MTATHCLLLLTPSPPTPLPALGSIRRRHNNFIPNYCRIRHYFNYPLIDHLPRINVKYDNHHHRCCRTIYCITSRLNDSLFIHHDDRQPLASLSQTDVTDQSSETTMMTEKKKDEEGIIAAHDHHQHISIVVLKRVLGVLWFLIGLPWRVFTFLRREKEIFQEVEEDVEKAADSIEMAAEVVADVAKGVERVAEAVAHVAEGVERVAESLHASPDLVDTARRIDSVAHAIQSDARKLEIIADEVKEETKTIHDKVEEVLGVVKDKIPGLKETRPATNVDKESKAKTHNANSATKTSKKNTSHMDLDRFLEKEVVSSIPSPLTPLKQPNIKSFPYQLDHIKAHQFLSFKLRLLGTFFIPILRGPRLSLSWINRSFLLRLIVALLFHSVLLGNMDVIHLIQSIIFNYH